MKKVYFKGYVSHEEKDYTFTYADGKLELINLKHSPDPIQEYRYIKYLKGFTVDGFDIIFHIDRNCYYKNGTYVCYPQIIFISNDMQVLLDDSKFDSLCFKGEIINRFYSNRNMIQIKDKPGDPSKKVELIIKKTEETIVSEKAVIDNIDLEFELSNIKPGWKDDGIFTFDDYDSLLRLKYSNPLSIDELLPNIISIQKLMQFCSNRKSINYSEVFLEIKDKDLKYHKKVLIFIPLLTNNSTNKHMIEYDIIKGKISKLFEYFNKSEYVLANIPSDNKDFNIIDNKRFGSNVSCFQSTYNIVNNDEEVEPSNESLNEIKCELNQIFEELDKKYTGVDGKKRKYLSRFNHIIQGSDLTIENMLKSEIEKHDYILECLNYRLKGKIKEVGIEDSCHQAIANRDDITHKDLVQLDEIDVGIYLIIEKLNHILVLEYCGIENEKIQKCIEFLSQREII